VTGLRIGALADYGIDDNGPFVVIENDQEATRYRVDWTDVGGFRDVDVQLDWLVDGKRLDWETGGELGDVDPRLDMVEPWRLLSADDLATVSRRIYAEFTPW
jgi:hypothetical protein